MEISHAKGRTLSRIITVGMSGITQRADIFVVSLPLSLSLSHFVVVALISPLLRLPRLPRLPSFLPPCRPPFVPLDYPRQYSRCSTRLMSLRLFTPSGFFPCSFSLSGHSPHYIDGIEAVAKLYVSSRYKPTMPAMKLFLKTKTSHFFSSMCRLAFVFPLCLFYFTFLSPHKAPSFLFDPSILSSPTTFFYTQSLILQSSFSVIPFLSLFHLPFHPPFPAPFPYRVSREQCTCFSDKPESSMHIITHSCSRHL